MKQSLNKQYTNNAHSSRQNISTIIGGYIKAAQSKIAIYLQLKTERFTRRGKKVFLLLFSLLFGGCSIAIILYSFITINAPVRSPVINFPKYATTQKLRPKIKDSLITQKEYEPISQFKLFMEHLQQDISGKKMYDSLVQARPKLLDSIHQVDSIFLHQ